MLPLLVTLTSCATSPETEQVKKETAAAEEKNIQLPTDDIDKSAKIEGNFRLLNDGKGGTLNIAGFRKQARAEETPGGITLNFVNADIKEVVSLIIGKILKENYLIDPAVKGTVNLNAVKELNKNTAFYVLENILDIHGARIIRHKGHYRIIPKNRGSLGLISIGANKGNAQHGYGYHIVPLNFIQATEMLKILESVTNKGALIRADDKRNLLIIGGTGSDVTNMLDAVKLFDVDMMRGTSVGLIRIRYSNVQDIIKDIRKMAQLESDSSAKNGLLSLESIDRLNALLIITRQSRYLERVKDWVAKLDIPSQGDGQKLHVYQVKNSNAKELAANLTDLFGGGAAAAEVQPEEHNLSPGSSPVFVSTKSDKPAEQAPEKQNTASPAAADAGGIKIIAASDTNSLLVLATPNQFAKVEEALKKLDTPPLQVLIEVSIMDISLTDDFSYGMQWFFNNTTSQHTGSGQVGDALTFPATLSYSAVKYTGDIRALLSILASDGKVDVLSSPSLLVRNNGKASIRVGNQQPISTALVGAEGNIVATSVQFKDTGVILEINPTINSSGMVNVDITQEVTDVGDVDDATGQRAFLRRSLKSSVSVSDGESIVLGGLIRTNTAKTSSGVPWLHRIPILGFFLGKTITSEQRTELLIMLTPKVIKSGDDNRKLIDEFRNKFDHLVLDKSK